MRGIGHKGSFSTFTVQLDFTPVMENLRTLESISKAYTGGGKSGGSTGIKMSIVVWPSLETYILTKKKFRMPLSSRGGGAGLSCRATKNELFYGFPYTTLGNLYFDGFLLTA